MVSNCTSACCTCRLARGNAQEQTHSETSSNYLCTNDGLETGGIDSKSSARSTAARNTQVPSESSHRTRSIAAMTAGSSGRVLRLVSVRFDSRLHHLMSSVGAKSRVRACGSPGAVAGDRPRNLIGSPGRFIPRKGPWRAMISELHNTYWDALPVAGQPVYVGDRWWLSRRRLKSVVSVAEQGCSLRRVGRHWRVRWSYCWRGRRRCWRSSWS